MKITWEYAFHKEDLDVFWSTTTRSFETPAETIAEALAEWYLSGEDSNETDVWLRKRGETEWRKFTVERELVTRYFATEQDEDK